MILEDSFGRQFHYLRLSITDRCNFRCNYCLPEGSDCSAPQDFLSLNEIQTLVASFARLGTSKVRITGGEPTLRKDLADIIEVCKQTPGIDKVAITTNGLNLKRHIEGYKAAGLDAINISADSLDPQLFQAITGRDKLDNVLAGIEACIAVGLKQVKINTVLLRQFNGQELNNFLAYLKQHPVSWRFIELMQTGDNQGFFAANHISGQSIKTRLLEQGWQRIVPEKNAGPAQEFSHPEHVGKVGLIMPYSSDFCNTCNRLRVSAEGKLHLCLFAEQGFDLRPELQAGDVAATCTKIQALMGSKKDSHALQMGFTGATRQLAMLGG